LIYLDSVWIGERRGRKVDETYKNAKKHNFLIN